MSITDCCMPCMQRDEDLPKPIDPIAVIKGTKNQDMMPGKYAGSQCTSICVAALAWFYSKGKRGHFTTEAIDTVLHTGNELHRYLREIEKVSKAADMRVALDDLPQMMVIEDVQLARNSDEEHFAILFQPNEGFADFLMLKDLLLRHAVTPFGILITVGHYSQAIFFTCNGRWTVFDSHGYLTFKCRLPRPYASAWEFDSVDAVIGFLVEVRRGECHCQVHKPTVISLIPELVAHPAEVQEREPAINSIGSPGGAGDEENRTEVLSPTTIEVIPMSTDDDDNDDDEDPYVCLMGGF